MKKRLDSERERRRGWILVAAGSLFAFGPLFLLPARSPVAGSLLALFDTTRASLGIWPMFALVAAHVIGLTLLVLGVVRLARFPARSSASEAVALRRRVADLGRQHAQYRRAPSQSH